MTPGGSDALLTVVEVKEDPAAVRCWDLDSVFIFISALKNSSFMACFS